MPPAFEHRAHTRIPVQARIKVGMGKGRLAAYAIAINLSLGGVLLSATPALTVGSTCHLTLFGAGGNPVTTSGKVIRSDGSGTAVQFVSNLAPEVCQSIVDDGHGRLRGLFAAYVNCLQVGRNPDNAGCERLLGVSKRTFRTVFYATFAGSLPLAILPVWWMRDVIQPFAAWEKILASFVYGFLWMLVLQPGIELGLLRFFRGRRPLAGGA